MRGIVSIAGYVPYRRLQRVRGGPGVRHRGRQGHPVGGLPRRGHHHHGGGGGPPGPAVGARGRPRAPSGSPRPRPAYLDKTNATAIHAALRQPSHVAAFDFGGALRSGVGRPAVRPGRRRARAPPWWCWPTCGTACPRRPTSRPGATGPPPCWSATTAPGTPVIAEYLGGASVTDEFLDRWRTAGDRRSKVVGGALRRDPLRPARRRGLGVGPEGGRARPPTRSTGWRSPACTAGRSRPWPASWAWATARWPTTCPPRWARPGPPTPGWCWPPCSSRPSPGQVVAVVALADGADVLLFRTTDGPGRRGRRPSPVADQIAGGRRPPLRQVPDLAGHGHPRAAPAARAPTGLGLGRLAQRGLEVRLRRLPRPHLRGRAPAAGPGLDEGRGRRRHGPGRPGRHRGHHRHLHHRPAGLLAQPAHRLRRARLRRRRAVPGGADRRRPRPRWTSATG